MKFIDVSIVEKFMNLILPLFNLGYIVRICDFEILFD